MGKKNFTPAAGFHPLIFYCTTPKNKTFIRH
jgi:hypothetical protein